MKILFGADLHYALKQFDWLTARAGSFDLAIIGGDLLDLGSAFGLEVQIRNPATRYSREHIYPGGHG